MRRALKPELKDVLVSYILAESNSEESDRKLRRMKAVFLYEHALHTRPQLAEKHAQHPDLLLNSANQSEFLPLDQVFIDARYDVPATITPTKARRIANSWYSISIRMKMVHKLLNSEDGGEYDQLFDALSRMTEAFWQTELPLPTRLCIEMGDIIQYI